MHDVAVAEDLLAALQQLTAARQAISDEIGEEIYIRTSDAKDRGMEVYTGMKEKSTELAEKRAEASIERRSEIEIHGSSSFFALPDGQVRSFALFLSALAFALTALVSSLRRSSVG